MKMKSVSAIAACAAAVVMAMGMSVSAESVTEAATESVTEAAQQQTEAPTVTAGTDSEDAVHVVALKGPTAMGMVKMMADADSGELTDEEWNFQIVPAVDQVPPMLVQGTADIAALPANMASVIYNNTQGGVEVLAVNTLGVLYICDNGNTVNSVADLKGKTIYASGKGATPEYALNYILTGNGIDPEKDVTIEWKAEHAECLAALLADENAIAMLPQPFVTTAQTENPQIRTALDMTAEWDALQADAEDASAMITGVVVARKEFVEENPQAVEAFLADYQASVEYVNVNVSDAAQLVGNYKIVPAQVAELAIPACNITFIAGEEMEQKVSGYLTALFEQNPKAVGGALPEEDFYYVVGSEQ